MIAATAPRTVSARIRHLYLAIAFGLVIGMIPIGLGSGTADAATAPTFRSSATASGDSSTVAVSVPPGVQADDVLVAQISRDKDSAAVTPPAGWLLIREDLFTSKLAQSLYVKVASGSEPPSYTFTLSEAVKFSAGIAAYSGADTSAPVEAHSGTAAAKANPFTAPSVTSSSADVRLVAFFANVGPTAITPPAGMTERWDFGGDVAIASADEAFVGPGATGDRTASFVNSEKIAQMIALAPASGGGPAVGDAYLIAGTGGGNGGDDLLTLADPSDNNTATNETNIGTGTSTSIIKGMAVSPGTGAVYAAVGPQLGVISPSTGVWSPIGAFGSGDGSAGSVVIDDVNGLAFDATTGFLYGVENRSGATDLLFRADPASGAVVTDAFGAGVDYVVIQSVGARDEVSSIAIHPSTGVMYAGQGDDGGGQNQRLTTINKTTGATSTVGDTDPPILTGLDFDASGNLWATGYDGSLPAQQFVYRVSTSNASILESISVDNGGDYSAIGFSVAPAYIVTVNATGDSSDNSPGDGVCDTGGTVGSDPECTLRAAIQEANASATVDTIHFNIPGAGPHTISVSSALPAITATATIDGTTQEAFSGDNNPAVAQVTTGPEVIIDYGEAVAGDGLDADAPNTSISGIGVNGAGGHGILVSGDNVSLDSVTVTRSGENGVYFLGTAGSQVTNTVTRDNGVSNSVGDGFTLWDATNITISGNDIVGNAAFGIDGASGALTGITIDSNVISGNGFVNSSQQSGIGVRTGASMMVSSNTITANNGNGVTVVSGVTGVAFSQNSVFGNGGIGIDLSATAALTGDGVTMNDSGDGDSGGNELLNFPVITSATEASGTVTVTFDLDVPANPEQYRVEFFANPSGADPSGYGESETSVSMTTTTPGTGLTHTFTGTAGDVITATATRIDSAASSGFASSSEISAAYTVTGGAVTTVSFQEGTSGYSGTIDTWVSGNVPNQDNSTDSLIQVDGDPYNQGLIRFENIIGAGAGQIPAGATIVSAQLTLVAADPSSTGATLDVHRMLRSWVETDTWNTLTSGVSIDDVEASTGLDGQLTSGLDVIDTPVTVTGLGSAVQAWVDGSPNDGWLLVLGGSTNGWDPRSSENASVSWRPKLEVTYAVGPLTFIVNSTSDSSDANPGDAVCDTGFSNSEGDPQCTLRAAIQEANAVAGADNITFAMPTTESGHSGGVWTISPGSEYPTLTEAVKLDARTQTGYSTTPVVELNGSSAGSSSDGLRVFSPNVEIRGLAINRFGADGIEVDTTSTGGVVIAGNHIGVDPTGLIDRGNGGKGIDLQTGSGPTTVGGTTASDRNVISGNGLEGIILWGSDGNSIIGNYIGTDVTGNAPIPNTNDGLHIGNGADNNTFGQPGAGNVLSGNGNDGLEIDDVSGGNIIQANIIGLGADGSTVVANGRYGVVLYNGANTTQIGGSGAGEGNVISANGSHGVALDGNSNAATSGNVIAGNLIGTDNTGLLDRGNGGAGIYLFAGVNNTTVGGSTAGHRNVISGNTTDGVYLQNAGTTDTVIKGNYIGVDITGNAALPNGDRGVQIESGANNTIVGGTAAGEGNVISANGNDGIIISDGASPGTGTTGTIVEGNLIGVGADGTTALGNGTNGVRVTTEDGHRIGGTAAGAGNVIANNGGRGVDIQNATASSNPILGNSIYSNTNIGIDLGDDGVTVNDSGDGDSGANGLLNFPVITAATESGGTVTVEFDLDVPAGNYRVEFFTNPSGADGSGHGEGESYVSSVVVTAGTGLSHSFSGTVGDVITATATHDLGAGSYGDTSEFSLAVTVVSSAPVANDDSATTDEDTAVVIDVVANDTDPNGDSILVATVGSASNGSVVNNGDGTVTYTPSANFNGSDSFTYTATDGTDTSNTATVTVTVTPVNDAPVANDDSATTDEDTAIVIDLIANDTDIDGDTLSFVSVSNGANGSVVDNGDGTVTYTPDLNWNGTDSFVYSVTDGTDNSNIATVTVTVNAVNDDPPVAVGDNATTAEDTPVVIDLVANDTDPDGDSLLVGSIVQPTNGTVVDNGDGTVTYTPDADYDGTESFTYTATDGTNPSNSATVWVTVTPVNDTPVAVGDSASTAEDTPVIVSVLANDTDVDGDTLSVDSFTQPTNGTVTDNGDGTLTYTPDADYSGSDSFTYVANDGTTTSNTATVTMTVNAVNDAPVASDDSVSTPEDTAVVIAPLANDADPEGDPLSIDSFTQPTNGTVTDNGDGTLTYTPDADYFGPDSFTYVATDGTDTSNIATVTVTVTSVNDAPTAVGDSTTTAEDTAVVIDLLGNDTDPEGDTLSIQGLAQPSNGTVTDNGDGTVTYTPDADFNGSDPFTYSITDGTDPSNLATVSVTVTPVNDAPVAVDDVASTPEDTAVIVSVLANDTDADGDALSIDSFTQPANGAVTDNGDGTLTYTPDANYSGPDSFTYVALDGTASSNTASVSLTVSPVNDAPVAIDDTATTNEDAAVVIDLVANDTDVEGDGLLVGTFAQGSSGTVSDNGDGTVTYIPNSNFNGTDSFTYTATDGTDTSNTATVTVTVNPVNDAPVAVDDSASTPEDTAFVVAPLANDTDPEGDTLSIDSFTQPANGTVTDNGDGTLTYAPDPDFNGSDSFTYVATDGTATSNTGSVAVTVTPMNDAPVANNDSGFTSEDTAVVIDLLANDVDVDGDILTFAGISNGASGSVVDNGDGTATYTPNPDFNGTDTFSYSVTDGTVNSNAATVTVTVSAVNDAPVALGDTATTDEDTAVVIDLVANDTDVDGDALLVDAFTQGSSGTVVDNGDGTVTYTPNADFNGLDTFTYSATDGTDPSNTVTVVVTVNAVNDAPVANDDSATTDEDTAVVIDLLGNDTDLEGDALSIVSVSNGANGSVTDNGNGTVTYTPDADFNGTDSFVYSVTDGTDNSNIATVTLTVNPLADAPVAVDDAASTPEDTSVVIDVVANDTDADGDTLLVDTLGAASSGSVTDNGDGTVTYTPAADFVGSATFTYSATDGALTSNTATVTVTVTAVNDAPVAVDDGASTAEDTAVVIGVVGNDTDVDGDTLSIDSFTQGANGTVTSNGDGTVTYAPDLDSNGSDSFTYVVTDGTATSNTATVTVTVTAVGDAPVATADTASTAEDTAVVIGVAANDTDVDGDLDPTSTSVTSGPANGTAAPGPFPGSITYAPDADFNGSDSFTYEICDATALCDTAVVSVTVTAVNDAPVAADDSVSTLEDTAVVVTVLSNDSDVDGDPLSVGSLGQGANGTVTDNGDGTVSYTPDLNFNGTDSFTYVASDGTLTSNAATVTVTVGVVNDAPVAADDAATTPEDTGVSVDVVTNDTDVDGDPLAVATVGAAANGSVVDNGDGTVTYTPGADFNGTDSFTYTVTDGTDTSNTATVTVTVTAVNDAPVAAGDTATTAEDAAVTVGPLGNDSDVDGDPLSVASVGAASNGSVVDNGDGTVTYTPDADFDGIDSFTYTATDGTATSNTATVTVTVTAVNDAPVAADDAAITDEDTPVIVAVLGNDSDVDGDPLSVASVGAATNGTVTDNGDGTVTYTPNLDFNGADSFTYTLTDGTDTSNTATVTVTVNAVNDTPVAADDSPVTDEDTAVTFDVLGNDVDADADPLTIDSLSPAANGTVTDNGDGTFTYTPNTDFNGLDTFTYTLTDATDVSNTATVTVTVNPVNDAPVAIDDTAATSSSSTVTIDVVANDIDLDGDVLTVTALSTASSGTVTDNGDGTVEYRPNRSFSGDATFTYTISDGALTDTGLVTVAVTLANTAPVVSDLVTSIPETTSAGDPIGTVVASDPDGDGMVFTVNGDPRLQIGPNGSVTLVGVVTAGDLLQGVVTVTDANGAATQATITITVTAVNSAPVISDQSFVIDVDANTGSSVGSVSASDPDGDVLSFSIVGAVPFSIDAEGRLTVAADLSTYGGATVTFSVLVTDPDGQSSGATMTVAVRGLTPTNTTSAPSTTLPSSQTTSENRAPIASDDLVIGSEDSRKLFDPLSNDLDPDGDPLTLTWLITPSEGEILRSEGFWFVPQQDWSGTTTALYRIDDGRGKSDVGTVTFVVNPVNDAPRIQSSNVPAKVSSGGSITIPLPSIIDPESDAYTVSIGDPEHGTAELIDSQIVYRPDPGYEGQDTIQLYVVDTAGAGSRGVIVIEVVIDGATISVKILDLGEIGSDPEGGVGLAGVGGDPGGDGGGQFVLLGIPFFGLIASEVLSATWAVRAPLVAFVVVAAITLLATTRQSFSLAIKPLPVARSSDLTWSIVLVGEFERLPALSGPDHSNKAISWFDAGVTGIESTGNLMMTNGTLWVEVATSAGRAWVEARHVTPGRPEPTEMAKDSMVAVRNELFDRISRGEPFSHLVSGRGLYMQVGEEISSVPQNRVDPLLSHILRDGDPDSKQLIHALSMPLVDDSAHEVPVELRNFEYLVVGEGWDRWALYFERGTDGRPLLVGVSPARVLVGA